MALNEKAKAGARGLRRRPGSRVIPAGGTAAAASAASAGKPRRESARRPAPGGRRRGGLSAAVPSRSELDETELLVLEDVDNGNEYYLAQIDRFSLGGREYVVMLSYEPDDGAHRDPEIVMMRFAYGEGGEQYFQSIRSRRELARVFDAFFERYVEAN